MWNLKHKQTQIHRERNQLCGYKTQRTEGGSIGGRWVKGTTSSIKLNKY